MNFDRLKLQQTYEHNEAATLPVLTEIGLRRYGVIPLWNPYMLTGFPYAGDFISNFWNPVATLPILLWGGVNGYKVGVFLSFVVAGIGQWLFGSILGLRSPVKLWSALVFMLSGGLALFWHLGWYQLLIGVVWFPCCFAALIWALRSRRRAPLGLAALAITMVLTSAGAYYFFYLGGSLAVLTLVLLLLAPSGERLVLLGRAALIAALSAGLIAVVMLPGLDVYRHTIREAPPDPLQGGSLPISYALFQYVLGDPAWFHSDAFGRQAGYMWYYIGSLPVAALLFVPLAFNGSRRRRNALIVAFVLTLLFLAWHANRHTPIGWLYRAFPVLYTFRFPARLLVPATSPLLVLAGFGVQALWVLTHRATRRLTLSVALSRAAESRRATIPLRPLALALCLGILALSVRSVYKVNRGFAFTTNQPRDQVAVRAIEWLHQHDPSLYYVAIGDYRVWWTWTTAVYEAEQPAVNFVYNRMVRPLDPQPTGAGLVQAAPKYVFPWNDTPPPAGGTLLQQFDTVRLYEMPAVLPYAFAVSPERLSGGAPLRATEVRALEARWANPNQLVVEASAEQAGLQAVALVSMFPGWKVAIDGRPATLAPVNNYLGVTMLEGRHTYTFSYQPPLFYIGLAISAASLLVTLALITGVPQPRWVTRVAPQTLRRRVAFFSHRDAVH
ncbi:MAG TPA: hypothetical protein VER55_00300 [Ardenticatenaceae bacterium]|nr:hypothetical protein [Ardenticatenaceae bacterium]